MVVLIRLGASMLPAFFLAGAVVFPIVEPFYMSRVLLTGGLAALMYGLESVIRIGHIETCGLLSGNCTQHSVRLIGGLLWAAMFGLWPRLGRSVRGKAESEGRGAADSVSTTELALALGAVVIGLTVAGGSLFRPQPGTQGEATAPAIDRVARTHPYDAAGPHGLTFGLLQAEAPAAGAMTELGCHARPAPADRPHRDSCNPYEGDTSCRAILPIACRRAADLAQLAATRPVAGSSLISAESGSQRCAAELGDGWRMATFHDGAAARIPGQHVSGLRPSTRYWVAIGDQPGNCWSRR